VIQRLLLILIAHLVGLLAVVAAKTTTVQSRQLDVAPSGVAGVDRAAAAERLAQAIRFRSIAWGANEPVEAEALRGLHAFLVQSFPRVHAALRREIVNGHSLLYTWRGQDAGLKPILLLAHLDVVPVDPRTEAQWSHPAFAGVIADGFIWGRGTLDDKSSLLATLEAVEQLLELGFTPRRTVYLAFGHDEEVLGAEGAARIAARLAERGIQLEVTLDEAGGIVRGLMPGVEAPIAMLAIAEKGYLSLELTVQDAGGHSSAPPPSTAIGRLARAVVRLEENPLPAAISDPVEEMFKWLAPEMPLPLASLFANRWLFGPLIVAQMKASAAAHAMTHTTTAATLFRGGVKENVLPAEATAVINFRLLPGDSVENVIEHARAAIDDPSIAILPRHAIEPLPVGDVKSTGFALIHRTIREVFPDVVVAPILAIGTTDSRHYAPIAENNYRFVPWRLGPDDLGRFHGVDERLSIEAYGEGIRFYLQLLRNASS
jgi:carboxypeptidase PM20D1